MVRTDSLKGRRGRLPSKSKMSDESSGITGAAAQLQPLTKALVNAFTGNGSVSPKVEYGQSIRHGVRDQFVDSINASITAVHRWAERIPGWNSIDERDRHVLLKQAGLYALSLRLAYK